MANRFESGVERVFDGVLINSMMQYRRALRLLERNGSPRNTPYIEQIRNELRKIEEELKRRGIGVNVRSEGEVQADEG